MNIWQIKAWISLSLVLLLVVFCSLFFWLGYHIMTNVFGFRCLSVSFDQFQNLQTKTRLVAKV